MSKNYKKTSVFIDTNILQSFVKRNNNKKDYVFLSNLGVPRDYYTLVAFITDNRLQNNIEICVSEVVFGELRQHMINNFNSFCDSIESDMTFYSKIAGDLFEYSYRIKQQKESYPAFVDSLIDDFINNPKNMCRYIPVSSKENLLDILLDKSLRGVKPFAIQTIEGKSYKDAGFKDSIIAETIYAHCSEDDRKCLLISKDSDFGQKFKTTLNETNKFVRCSSVEQAIELLKEYYEISAEDNLKREFTENTYLHECLLSEAGIKYDESVTKCEVEGVYNFLGGGDIFIIKMIIIVNETEYFFTVKFDSIANEILDVMYLMKNE